jgi:FkbM family methyltransferase
MQNKKIDLDFVEIGTSDFDNLISMADDTTCGISIEVIKVYFDKLPTKKNVKKINCAVSNKDGELTSYWVSPEDIEIHSLPNWIRGCGTINHQHPLILNELNNRNLLHIYKSAKCEVISWKTLIERENINSVKFLKIDAEGSDYSILESILKNNASVLPEKIQFENKDFMDNVRMLNIISEFLDMNYSMKNVDNYNIILER